MKPIHQIKPDEFSKLVDDYFKYIEGSNQTKRTNKTTNGKSKLTENCEREPEPPTVTGMAYFLGFKNREQFDKYKNKSKFSTILQRALLRIESIYEKRLHQHSTSGAIFMLKNMGWYDSKIDSAITQKSLDINIINAGPAPVSSEKEVMLEDQYKPKIIELNDR